MGKNINTGIWTVDGSGYTQTVADLFTGADPVYTHADHIDNSFNFCVNGVSEQNSRMCLHMTNRGDNKYTVDDVANVFIPDLIYDNNGNNVNAFITKVLMERPSGGVSNFAIPEDSGSQPSADFKIHPSFDYRNALWYPKIGFAKYSDIGNRYNIGYTYYSLNDLDGVSTAVDANPDETWWEYYTRKSSDYVMCLDCYNGGTYYTGGGFHSNSIVEGQTRFGFVPAWVCWLSTPYYWGYSYGVTGCYYYFDNGQGRYSDLEFDVIFSLSSDAMTKIDEYDDTWYDSYNNPYPRHNIVYTPKIDKNLVLRLICSYGLPFSFSSSTVDREFADPDYALPVIINNTTTGEYVRGADCITADTENNRWVNTADIDNKPAGGGGGGGSAEDDIDSMGFDGMSCNVGGPAKYYIMSYSDIHHLIGDFNAHAEPGTSISNNIISCYVNALDWNWSTGSEPIEIYSGGAQTTAFTSDINYDVLTGYNARNIIGSIDVPRMTNSFYDFSPYSTYEVYVPFCGWVALPDTVAGRHIKIYFETDEATCGCKGRIFFVDDKGNGVTVAEITGSFGAPCPIQVIEGGLYKQAMLSNGLQVIGGIASGIMGGASGSGVLAVGGLSNAMQSLGNCLIAGNTNYGQTIGRAGDASGLMCAGKPYLKITYPPIDEVVNNSMFGHTVGYLCNTVGQLNKFSGFTVCGNPHIHISATSAEKEEIKRLLEQGVILP